MPLYMLEVQATTVIVNSNVHSILELGKDIIVTKTIFIESVCKLMR